MKFSLPLFLACAASTAEAFAPTTSSRVSSITAKGGMSDDIGIPCEEECAIEKYPNLPESVHPGVLSGQAMMDLLDHAKENGKELIGLTRVDSNTSKVLKRKIVERNFIVLISSLSHLSFLMKCNMN